ncbi:MAG TPA: tetratricopeptide repeat protein, partial [bacterium]|nr:tetratricopeptide repeat protein [bacterium]
FYTREQVLMYLRNRHLLLLLDNFEHLIDGVHVIRDISESAPGVRCLVTSRRRLNIRTETVFDVSGLGCPSAADAPVESSDALKLFVQSARRVSAGFRLSESNRQDVTDICRLVGGMPLAIELAASWTRLLEPGMIASEMQRDPDFLASSLSDIPDRHRTIRCVFDQAWTMLSEDARDVFLQLSPFRGGFTPAAARSAAGAGFKVLGELIDTSIVYRTAVQRLEIHEVLRQFAEERLSRDVELNRSSRDRCAAYTLDVVDAMATPLRRHEQKEAFRTLAADIQNIRTAWMWCAKTRDLQRLRRAAPTLFLYFDLNYLFEEGMRLFGKAAELLGYLHEDPGPVESGLDSEERVLAGLLTGVFAWFKRYSRPVKADSSHRQRIHGEAARWAARATDLLAPFRERYEWALIRLLSIYMNREWELRPVQEDLDQCLRIMEKHEDNWGIAWAYHTMGCSRWDSDPEASEAIQRRCLEVRRTTGDTLGTAISYMVIAVCARRRGALDEALNYLETGCSIYRDMGIDGDGLIEILEKLGGVTLDMGDHDRAIACCEEALTLSLRTGNTRRSAYIVGSIGAVYAQTGRVREAVPRLNKCLELCRQSDSSDLSAHFSKILEKITQRDVSETIPGRRQS